MIFLIEKNRLSTFIFEVQFITHMWYHDFMTMHVYQLVATGRYSTFQGGRGTIRSHQVWTYEPSEKTIKAFKKACTESGGITDLDPCGISIHISALEVIEDEDV